MTNRTILGRLYLGVWRADEGGLDGCLGSGTDRVEPNTLAWAGRGSRIKQLNANLTLKYVSTKKVKAKQMQNSWYKQLYNLNTTGKNDSLLSFVKQG